MVRVLELFCGIGGAATALAGRGAVVQAFDINQLALSVYRQNHAHSVTVAALESITVDCLRQHSAEMWWMSPPCQPYTRRGQQRDLNDPRSQALSHLVELIDAIRPNHLVLENVAPFQHSESRLRLYDRLLAAGYDLREELICPTQLGVPNRRLRYYLVASRQPLGTPSATLPSSALRPLRCYLDRNVDEDFDLPPELVKQYAGALSLVDASNSEAVAACFTRGYGHSVVRSGSYLQSGRRVRRFTPREIARLLGFPEEFAFPATCTRRQQWQLLGNSVSIPAVRWILSTIPELPAPNNW